MRLVGWCCLGSSPQNVWEISKFTKENWKLRQKSCADCSTFRTAKGEPAKWWPVKRSKPMETSGFVWKYDLPQNPLLKKKISHFGGFLNPPNHQIIQNETISVLKPLVPWCFGDPRFSETSIKGPSCSDPSASEPRQSTRPFGGDRNGGPRKLQSPWPHGSLRGPYPPMA